MESLNLEQFTGTTQWYKHMFGMRYTDGIQYLAVKAGAYWLIDIVASYQPRFKNIPFQLWRIEVKDEKAVVTMREDTGRKPLVTQKFDYTDFPLAELEWYVCDNVMLLKGEY